MPNRKKRNQMHQMCGQLHEDDGIDPRDYFKTNRRPSNQSRKDQQLCSQVADTLHLCLSDGTPSDILHNLHILSVSPAPDASQLLVSVACDPHLHTTPQTEILAALDLNLGRLRSEIARSISRKRTPRLVFQIVQPTPPPVDDQRDGANVTDTKGEEEST